MDKRPIGIFDSGLGGLTALREVRKLMPHENIVYLGDTARVPYGTRSKETIRKYTTQDIQFLLSKDVKMIITACGTASSNQPQELIDSLSVAYVNVLLPAAQAACAATKTSCIGVIATPATIKSSAYGKAIRNIIHTPKIVGKACPMFVPLIENGYVNRDNPVTRIIAQEYLAPVLEEGIDTLILGCTHYPLIQELIQDLAGEQVTLIDPGKEAAKSAQAFLTNHRLLNDSLEDGSCHYYVTDNLEGFAQSAAVFLDNQLDGDVEQVNLDLF